MRSLLSRSISALLALTLLASAGPSFAQGKGKKGADAQPTDPKLIEAKKHMEAGAAFYNDPSGHKCEEAYREFKKAFELSGSMNAVKGMGLCAMELERDGEAISLIEKFLDAKGDSLEPIDKQQLESDVKALKAAVAWVTLSADRPGITITDTRTPARGYPVTNRYTIGIAEQKIGIHPGAHEFRANAEGRDELVWKSDISNGGTYEHTFEFDKGKPITAEGFKDSDLQSGDDKPKEESKGGVPFGAVIGAAVVTGAAAIGGVVVGGVLATGAKADYDAANGKSDKQTLEDMRSKVVTLNLVADVCFGVALAGGITTTILAVMSKPKAAKVEKKTEDASLVPWVGPQGGGALFVGSF